jgi:hypothetical protein
MQFVFQAFFEFIGTMLMGGPDALAKKPVWVRVLWAFGLVIVALLGAALLTIIVAILAGMFRGLSS